LTDLFCAVVRNKTASFLVSLICACFPEEWPTLFHDLMGLLSNGQAYIELFLRTLQAIDIDIIDPESSKVRDGAHIMKIVSS
jgi:hypothetical protein